MNKGEMPCKRQKHSRTQKYKKEKIDRLYFHIINKIRFEHNGTPKDKEKKESSIYTLAIITKMRLLLFSFLLVLILSYLFFQALWAVILLSPLILLLFQLQKRRIIRQLKWRLNLQFKDALVGMSAALSAGYSVENSISEALIDLRCIYKEDDLIIKEYLRMEQRVRMNTTIEDAFFEFATRSEIDDVLNFAWILHTAKRTGGDLIKITKNTSNMINERVEVKREIQAVVTAKKLESNIMNLVPLGIIVYLKLGCPGFLDALYETVAGAMIMGAVLVIYLAAYVVSQKIVNIQL